MDQLWQRVTKDKRILGGLALLIVLAAVPLTLNLSSQNQDIRQRAAEVATCSISNPIDAMLIIDKSGSMGPPVNTDDRINPAKAAAKKFVTLLYRNGIDQPKQSKAGVVSFAQLTNSTEGATKLDSPLITLSDQSKVDAVNAKINAIDIFGRTCTQCGIRLANEEIKAHPRGGVQRVVILLTDGGANAYDGHLTSTQAEAEKAANTEVDKGHAESGTIFYTIGLGKDVNADFLKDIAKRTGGKYYFAPTAADLDQIYTNISTIVGKGSITGTVYNDADGDKTKDSTETGQAGWKVSLVNANNQVVVASATTDTQGGYVFQGICDGSYQVKVTIQSGWTLTTPTAPDYINTTITGGNSLTDKNFGVKQAAQGSALVCSPTSLTLTDFGQQITATLKDSNGNPLVGKVIKWSREGSITQIAPTTGTTSSTGTVTTTALVPLNETAGFKTGKITASFAGDSSSNLASCDVTTSYTPKSTSLTLTVLLHGIGNSGDNVNPASSLSNKTPVHTNRNFGVSIYDAKDNKLILEIGADNLAYNSEKGEYGTTIALSDLGNNTPFVTGRYIIQVTSDYHLRKQFPGTVQINAGQNNVLAPITLIAGDADNNNQLNIADYNAVIDCYSDFEPPVSCDEDKKVRTDLNDDGKVNQVDYNLLLREWLVQVGDTVGT